MLYHRCKCWLEYHSATHEGRLKGWSTFAITRHTRKSEPTTDTGQPHSSYNFASHDRWCVVAASVLTRSKYAMMNKVAAEPYGGPTHRKDLICGRDQLVLGIRMSTWVLRPSHARDPWKLRTQKAPSMVNDVTCITV